MVLCNIQHGLPRRMIPAAPSTGFLSAGIIAINPLNVHGVRHIMWDRYKPTYCISWVDSYLEMHQIKARGNNILLCVLLAGCVDECKNKFGEPTVDLS